MMEEAFSLRQAVSDFDVQQSRGLALAYAQEQMLEQFAAFGRRLSRRGCLLVRLRWRYELRPRVFYDSEGNVLESYPMHEFSLDGVVRGDAPDVAELMIQGFATP